MIDAFIRISIVYRAEWGGRDPKPRIAYKTFVRPFSFPFPPRPGDTVKVDGRKHAITEIIHTGLSSYAVLEPTEFMDYDPDEATPGVLSEANRKYIEAHSRGPWREIDP